MTNIVKLCEDQALPGEVDEVLLAKIDEIRDMATRGELRAVAFAAVMSNGNIMTGWDTPKGTSFTAVAAASVLLQRLTAWVGGGDDGE